MSYDPVMADLAAELRRDELAEAHDAAINAAVERAEYAVREALHTAVLSLDKAGWRPVLPGVFQKGEREVVCELDGTFSAYVGSARRGTFNTAEKAAIATL